MLVFLAGIMQGSMVHNDVHEQTYRQYLADLLEAHVPGVKVFDPWAVYPNSLAYGDSQVHEVLQATIRQAAASDLVVAYLPQASMGTALEMWEARRVGVPIIAISPLTANWVIRTCANYRVDTLEEFAQLVRAGDLPPLVHRLAAVTR